MTSGSGQKTLAQLIRLGPSSCLATVYRRLAMCFICLFSYSNIYGLKVMTSDNRQTTLGIYLPSSCFAAVSCSVTVCIYLLVSIQ